MTHARAYGLLALVVLIWAGNYPLGKAGLSEFGPITLTFARAVMAAPFLLLAARGQKASADGAHPAGLSDPHRDLADRTRRQYHGVVLGPQVHESRRGRHSRGRVSGHHRADRGRVARSRLSAWNMVGIALTVASVLLTIARGSIDVLRALSFNKGDLIIMLSQIAWVTYTLYSRANSSPLGPASIQAGAYLVSVAVLAPLALLERPWTSIASASWRGWAVVVYSAGPITLGHLWYYQCVRAVGAGRAAVFTNVMPFLVIGLSWLLLGEAIRWYHVVGAVGVIIGVALATRR